MEFLHLIAVSRAVMSMAVHGADSDEGTSMAALDLKAGKGAPVMWPPRNENLGRFFEQSSCLQELDKFVFAFLFDNLACSAPDLCGFPVQVLHEQSSCLQALEIFRVCVFFLTPVRLLCNAVLVRT